MKQTPFQKHRETVAPGARVEKYFRRNIIIDHPARVIFIQIMWDGYGELNLQEPTAILKGEWWRFIPIDMAHHIREGIASGYIVRPMVLAGGPLGEEHTLLQILSVDDSHHMIQDSKILQPIEAK